LVFIKEESRYYRWLFIFGIVLVIISILLYTAHYFIFRDLHHIFIFLVKDLAFLPIKVLLITIIVHHLLNRREKQLRLEKMNMLISAFFSEVGTIILKKFSASDPNNQEIKNIIFSYSWDEKKLPGVNREMQKYDPEIDMDKIDLEDLKSFLMEKHDFILRQFENPYLLEHEYFSELLRAVSHLAEELLHRENLEEITKTDSDHLVKDIERVYILLIREWFAYMCHLNKNYPYLFSLALRLNPFDKDSSAEVT